MAADPAGERQVYRGAGAVVLWWAWAIFAVASLAAIAARYHDHGAAVAATVILAITGIMYTCALHPRVVAGPAGISVENPLRTHLIPWSAVTRVDLAQSLQVHYAGPPGRGGERVVHSWAVPGSPRARARRELRAQRESRRAPAAAAYARGPEAARAATQGSAAEFTARQLDERLHRERPDGVPASPGPVQVSWAWGPIAAMVVPLLALVVAAA
ncbi:MAG: PH domain-containing protein, partial [Streptosporangiales bacterium]